MMTDRFIRSDLPNLPRVPPDVCCDAMSAQLSQRCEQHSDPFECENVIYWSPRFDEYGLIIHDGGASYVVVEHCPWCGKKLPKSKRERWFKELERLGFEEPLFADVPSSFESDEWYRGVSDRL